MSKKLYTERYLRQRFVRRVRGGILIYREIEAKSLLSHRKEPDPWFGIKYNMNLYRGCEHQCIYCDSRSECYQIENFNDILIKVNAIDVLEREIKKKRKKGTIGTGSMSDPYTKVETKYQLTRRALDVIAKYRYPVHIITKSNLVIRDLDILEEINRVYAAISFTLITTDDQLAQKIEPYAPLPSERIKAMERLAKAGIYTGITMMPILPFICDTKINITNIVKKVVDSGGKYIISGFGMTLRDRQRKYYYDKLDQIFPGLSKQYKKKFYTQYNCPVINYTELWEQFRELCHNYKIDTKITHYNPQSQVEQLSLFSTNNP